MTEEQYLLICLAEEAAEVSLATSKVLRFGVSDGYPGTERTNGDDLAKEINDFLAIVNILEERNIIPKRDREQDILNKNKKLAEFTNYSRKLSIVK